MENGVYKNKLSKSLSPLNVWALAFGCIIGWGAFVMPGNTFLKNAGPVGTAIAMGIAAIIMMIVSVNYNYMINRFPVAGGEFTYTKETFGRKHGFWCSWFLGLSYLSIVPLNATALALIGRNLLNDIFKIGFHYSFAGYDIYLGEVLLSVVALILFGILSVYGVKITGVFQTILVLMLVAGVVIVGVAALISPEARKMSWEFGFYPNKAPVAGVLAVVAVAPWAFVGFDTIPQAAEEFNFEPKKTRNIMFFAIGFGAFVYMTLNNVTALVIPKQFTSWPEYIDALPDLEGIISLPTFNAAYMLLGNWGLIFLGISVVAAILSGIIGFYMATSRLLYSMAVENVLPLWFARVHSKYKTPYNAIGFVMIISLISSLCGRVALGWIVDMSSLGAAIGYGYTSAAAYKYAKREKSIVILVTGILGVIISLFFAILLLVPLPSFDCSLGKESYISLLVWISLGSLLYYKTASKK